MGCESMIFSNQGALAYRGLKTILHRQVHIFEQGLFNPQLAQEKVFQKICRNMQKTQIAQEKGYEKLGTLSDFRHKIPIQDFECYRPYVQRIVEGQHKVLSQEPCLGFVETSGTMSKSKWIPVTQSWSQHIQQAQSLWMLALLQDYPMIAKGHTWNIVSSDHSTQTALGLPVGANTGRMLNALPKIFRNRAATPSQVQDLVDEEIRQYVNLRFALQSNVTVWSTANPSTVLLYCRRLIEWQDFLAVDLQNGTLCQGPASRLSPDIQQKFHPQLRKMPVPRKWLPAAIWPLQVVNCWKGGPAAFFVQQLPEALGADIPVRDVGITASEGYFALPLNQHWQGGVLWNHGELLEFRDTQGQVFWSWELELGQQYELIISGLNGLLRYDLKDVVEVTDFVEATPIIRFVGKAGRFLNAVGEKITEEQMVLAVNRLSHKPKFFTAFIKMATLPHIEICMEGLSQVDLAHLSRELDETLAQISSEYASKRQTYRLGALVIHVVREGTYEQFRYWRIDNGATEAQVKDCIIATESEWAQIWKSQEDASSK